MATGIIREDDDVWPVKFITAGDYRRKREEESNSTMVNDICYWLKYLYIL